MKVLLVGVNSKFIHSNLAIRYLKAYTRDLDYECNTLEFSINDLKERVVKEIIKEKPDVIGFSCYIWNIQFIREMATIIKLINNDIAIFAGGPEVSFEPTNFLLQNSMDYIMEGEGEETYREFIKTLLESMQHGKSLEDSMKKVKGLYTKIQGEVYYGGIRDILDINKIVFPYSEEDNLENKIVYYEASRGCPFRCKYCLSSVDRKVRFLDIDRVKNELKFFLDKKVRLVKFVDRTFNCKDDFAKEIWRFIAEQDESVGTTFHFEISADLLKEEQIKILQKAPKARIQFEVGVQTTNNEILKNINRTVNFEDIEYKVLEVEKLKNIKQHLDLIAGLPGENFQSFKKSFDQVYSIKPEEIQLGFLKLLKGTPMITEKDKWGMVYSPYPPYEILKTKDISYDEICTLKGVEKMIDKYYNSNKFNNILKYFEEYYSSAFEFYRSLASFFQDNGYFDRNISSVEYYEIFLLFNEKVLKKSNYALNEIIKYDYLLHNKKKWVPPFINRKFDKNVNKLIRDWIKANVNYEKLEFHVEKFFIDICKFLQDGTIENRESYIIFQENGPCQTEEISELVEKLIYNEKI
ncbi:B12-binding domain-containing radical SAM protein [Clostridium sp. KNHs214]|uniref:B12-binding domain-containing radical SAM protein n=1 Tax=Clostridium sp. KNHs214 TaxID=1540257 RepID=UPI000553D61F|nr:B12-binding domain-containing radical SAM protein [Clostridium sp. KNHs214]